MDIHQLESIVRQMRAEKLALDYMDEVLTAVVTADSTILQAKKTVAALEQQVKDKEAFLAKFEDEMVERTAEHSVKLATMEKESALRLEAVGVEHRRYLDTLSADAEKQRQGLETAVAELKKAYEQGLKRKDTQIAELKVASDDLAHVLHETNVATAQLNLVREQLSQIQQSIRV